MNEKLLKNLMDAIEAIYDASDKDGLSANERGQAIRDYFIAQDKEGMLDEILGCIPLE